ncbi:MAG: response regulator [Deltaproteobacteria bacterium]|nr:response regulator [Deltaproteobacteria bacterium]
MQCLRVLIVDDDPKFLAQAQETLKNEKYDVTAVSNFDDAADHLRKVKGKTIILSELRAGKGCGFEFLRDTLRRYPDLPFTFLSTSPSLESVIEALKQGAYDFLRKPVAQGILLHSVARSVEKLNLSLESERVEKGVGERLSKIQADLKQTKVQAELKGFMISMAAHDFKSALTVLEGYYQDLDSRCSICASMEGAELVRQFGRSVRKLRAMANTLLDYEAARRGELQLQIKRFELHKVLNDCIAFYKPFAEQKQIRLVLENAGPGLSVKADPERVMQVLDNLLYNAIKFTPRDGQITVGAKPGDAVSATVWVADTGKGIPKAQAEKIFSEERIVSANDANARIGLGLHICKKLLEIQKGKIWLESEPGKGTKVSFSLPA